MALNDLIAASSGGAGAAFSTVLLYPLDVLKTRLNRGVDHNGKKYAGAFDVIRRVLSEHGVMGFYKGLSTRTSHQTVQKFAFYYVYDGLRRACRRMLNTDSLSFGMTLAIGYLAGVVTVLVSNPLEVSSTRQQLGAKGASGSGGILTCLVTMLREEGVGSFFRGSTANFVLAVNPAIENTLFDQIKDWYLRRWTVKSLSVAQAFWFGAVAKVIATAMTFPYIRAKVIMQAAQAEGGKALADTSSGKEGLPAEARGESSSVLQVLGHIAADEGVLALWKGMAPQAVKAVLSSAVLLAAKEKIEVMVRVVILALAVRG